jgi:ComF family protein
MMRDAGRDVLAGADCLVPAPLSRRRLVARRFNQSALLAGRLSRLTGLRHEPMVLKRVRETASQVGLSRHERRVNVRQAFIVPPARRADVAGRRIVLIDDVLTTGATANACAEALLAAGARGVDVLTAAHVVGEVDLRQP